MKFTLFTLFTLFASCKKDDNSISNPLYAIGTVCVYQSGNQHYSPLINYTFIGNGCSCRSQYTDEEYGKKWSIPTSIAINKGDEYMVEYDSKNVCNSYNGCCGFSRMLFSYPVRDSSDYNRYVAQFKTNPPQ